MKWLSVCVLTLVWGVAAPVELICDHPCVDGADHKHPQLGFARTFMVEDYRIEIYYKAHESTFIFSINCNGHYALDSSNLPKFDSVFSVNTVVLESCPPPNDGQTIQSVLEAMNVNLTKISPNNGTHLSLVKLPSYPILDGSHFVGMEYLTNLTINNKVEVELPKPNTSIIRPLVNLNKLDLKHIYFDIYPGLIPSLTLTGSEIEELHKKHDAVPPWREKNR